MTGLLFVPQTQLDDWLGESLVDVTAAGLHLEPAGRPLVIEPGFRFLSLLEGADAGGLLGKVKTEAELRALGAEPCGDSVLIGEVVYEVAPGFLVQIPAPGIGDGDPGVRGAGEGAAAPPGSAPKTK